MILCLCFLSIKHRDHKKIFHAFIKILIFFQKVKNPYFRAVIFSFLFQQFLHEATRMLENTGPLVEVTVQKQGYMGSNPAQGHF